MKTTDGWIDETVGALFDPIIVMPGGWGNDLPDWVKPRITVERLLENMKALHTGEEMTATDAEACAYLYTASLTAPISSDWAQVYLYVAGKEITRERKTEMPEDIRVEKLTDYQARMLADLKHWIYEARVKVRKERARKPRFKEVKQQELEVVSPKQPSFF